MKHKPFIKSCAISDKETNPPYKNTPLQELKPIFRYAVNFNVLAPHIFNHSSQGRIMFFTALRSNALPCIYPVTMRASFSSAKSLVNLPCRLLATAEPSRRALVCAYTEPSGDCHIMCPTLPILYACICLALSACYTMCYECVMWMTWQLVN